MSNKIARGANYLLNRPLLQADGTTDLQLADCSQIKCDLVQNGKTVASYTLAAGQALRPSDTSTSTAVLELTSAVTAALARGPLTEVWSISVANPAFVTEPTHAQVDVLTINDIQIV